MTASLMDVVVDSNDHILYAAVQTPKNRTAVLQKIDDFLNDDPDLEHRHIDLDTLSAVELAQVRIALRQPRVGDAMMRAFLHVADGEAIIRNAPVVEHAR